MKIHELKYSNVNTYLIEGDSGLLLFDTGWAGSFPVFCARMGELNIPVQKIDNILISHFHPDHMGIAQEIADLGPVIVVPDVQQSFIHSADEIFAKEGNRSFKSVIDGAVRSIDIAGSRAFLRELGIEGEIVHSPGHSDDSISLCLDDGTFFVGDLNPFHELELLRGTTTRSSWDKLLRMHPTTVYYGHAPADDFTSPGRMPDRQSDLRITGRQDDRGITDRQSDLYKLVAKIMGYVDKGYNIDRIRKKTGADKTFIEDVIRMYLTHRDVGVSGILDRIEIKGR